MLPEIHVPTLTLAMVGGFALMLAQIALSGWRSLPRRETLTWVGVCASLLISVALFALRAYVPEWLLVLTSNAALGIGLLAMVWVVLQLLDIAPRWRVVVGAFALYALVVALTLPLPQPKRIALTTAAAASFLLPLVVTVLRRGWGVGSALRSIGMALAVMELVLMWRAVDALLHPHHYQNLAQQLFAPLGHGLSMLLLMLAVLGVGFGYVLAAHERAQKQLHHLATRDPLTGCRNRRRLDQIMNAELARLRRGGAVLSFMVIDLDNFKVLNDAQGHAVGDAALKHVVRLLKQRLRTTDKLARMGGEEFGVVLPSTDAVGALQVAAQLRQALHDTPMLLADGSPHTLTASIGIVTLPSGSDANRHAVYEAADKAMYEAKRGGKDGARASGWADL